MVDNLQGIIEALLFVAEEPLSLKKLVKVTGFSAAQIEKVIEEIQASLSDQESGIQLRRLAGGYRLYTHPGYAEYVENLVLSADYRKLSQASLETLAIIAYRQPITRLNINAIRGVNSSGAIASLIERSLVIEVGRERGPGQPILYGTTKLFLENFGLNSLQDLPPIIDFVPDEAVVDQLQLKLNDRKSG
ncbi:MAG: SMC-Scp complex subunit ScpB [Actinomycetota bacterium]|nr:SMC-Scp complex subunit ScpB [Actinomycetota bacterium]